MEAEDQPAEEQHTDGSDRGHQQVGHRMSHEDEQARNGGEPVGFHHAGVHVIFEGVAHAPEHGVDEAFQHGAEQNEGHEISSAAVLRESNGFAVLAEGQPHEVHRRDPDQRLEDGGDRIERIPPVLFPVLADERKERTEMRSDCGLGDTFQHDCHPLIRRNSVFPDAVCRPDDCQRNPCF